MESSIQFTFKNEQERAIFAGSFAQLFSDLFAQIGHDTAESVIEIRKELSETGASITSIGYQRVHEVSMLIKTLRYISNLTEQFISQLDDTTKSRLSEEIELMVGMTNNCKEMFSVLDNIEQHATPEMIAEMERELTTLAEQHKSSLH